MNWDNALKIAPSDSFQAATFPQTISALELQQKEYPPVSWVVRDIIPEGLTLLAGKPKLGKSWLALQISYAVATGSEVLGRPVEKGAVLYAALEDNQRRLKSRLNKLTDIGSAWPADLKFATEWPRLDQAGVNALDAWIGQHPNARLIIIDTLATVRPKDNHSEKMYQSDYAALRGLHRLANQLHVAIVVVHHLRKAEADDPFDTVSGSTGLTGAADATLVLGSTTNGKVLYGRGRDLAEFESAIDFNIETCQWSDLGRPCDVHGSETRIAIRKALKAGKITPKQIAEHGELDYDLCAKTLQRMTEGGEVQKGGRGNYRLAPDPLS